MADAEARTPPPPLPLPPKPPRPQISLVMPAVGGGNSLYPPAQTTSPPRPISYYYDPRMMAMPMTPEAAVPIPIPIGLVPNAAYPAKASEFMFKQFEGFRDFTMNTAKSGLSVGEKFSFWAYNKLRAWSRRWFTHIFLLLVITAYSLAGAALFVAIEKPSADRAHAAAKQYNQNKLNADLVEYIRQAMESLGVETDGPNARLELDDIGRRLDEAYRGVMLHGEAARGPDWDYWQAVFYCGTVFTTIGYGHISPKTTTGRAATIVYAIFGIPMFLIVLADFGKLFTRGIKFVWAFVRRVYYTGSCRKVRRTVPVHEMMKGVQMVYDIATFRRPSQLPPGVTLDDVEGGPGAGPPLPPRTNPHTPGEPPGTPALSTFEIDDEFNLPISLAIFILLLYIICGALVFTVWEDWTFFESFYFVFISMSTIGFGDITPKHQMYMMASIIYLVFGLALTSMCINVVQEKLSDSFRQASAKIGATIGFRVGEDDGSVTPVAPPPVEIAEVHGHGGNKTATNGAPSVST